MCHISIRFMKSGKGFRRITKVVSSPFHRLDVNIYCSCSVHLRKFTFLRYEKNIIYIFWNFVNFNSTMKKLIYETFLSFKSRQIGVLLDTLLAFVVIWYRNIMKWSMKWPNGNVLSRHTFLWPYMLSGGALQWLLNKIKECRNYTCWLVFIYCPQPFVFT